ncbi:uncharacterized protein LOC142511762 [Primulina tabacum]|uniref:uncharacterized protein LOC142511762 n=1 Tax=Primulina tabacum TaxID=48773 RepID=UPI003F597D89
MIYYILRTSKKWLEHPEWLFKGFREALNDGVLQEISMQGYQFTWSRSRCTPNAVEERLDRAFGNSEWMALFPDAQLSNLVAAIANHSPLLLKTIQPEIFLQKHKFHFENKWLREPILRNWYKTVGMLVQVKIYFPDLRGALKYYQIGERNALQLSKEYFADLYSESNRNYDLVMNVINTSILAEDNNMLLAPYTLEKFKEAVFQMHPDKSPGPDGFNPAFYQKICHLMGQDAYNNCKKWMEQVSFPAGPSDSNIVLIPKCDTPSSMKDFRSIALCNVELWPRR